MNRWVCESLSNCSTSHQHLPDRLSRIPLECGTIEGESPVRAETLGVMLLDKSRAVWECSTTARCISGKAKYWSDTDSVQVVRTKDEKHSAKRVKQRLKPSHGKARDSIDWSLVADRPLDRKALPLTMPA